MNLQNWSTKNCSFPRGNPLIQNHWNIHPIYVGYKHGRSQDFGRGNTYEGRPRGGSGEFSKSCKKFRKKIAKNALF